MDTWVAAAVLLATSQFVLRLAMPGPGPHKRRRERDRRRVQEPPPIEGAAAGLLEHIPFIEPVKGARRIRVGATLFMALTLASAILGVALYLAGKALTLWAQSLAN